MADEQLKPCPFCGGEAEIEIDFDSNTPPIIYYADVFCAECDSAHVREVNPEDNQWENRQCITDAVNTWNTRHKEPE